MLTRNVRIELHRTLIVPYYFCLSKFETCLKQGSVLCRYLNDENEEKKSHLTFEQCRYLRVGALDGMAIGLDVTFILC
jgi:hypothetical protein